MEKNEKGCFNVHVYSPGNMFANNITFEAPVYIGGANNLTQQNGFTDDQIAQAIKEQQYHEVLKIAKYVSDITKFRKDYGFVTVNEVIDFAQTTFFGKLSIFSI